MIEKIKLDSLNFKEIVIKEDVRRVSLKEIFDKILPLFEKAYQISKKYDTRSKFNEDEDYINTRIEIGEILLLLRKSYENFGLSDEDQEFLKKLNLHWERFIRDFPVFNGEANRLLTFWFLSYLDVLEIPFDSDFKITSFVDLFFFEKIIDYIVSEKGEEQISEEDILEKFQRFTAPIDHYRALGLVLDFIQIENNDLKKKLFSFLETLLPKLKTKIKVENIIFDKIRWLSKQEYYDEAISLLQEKKGTLLKTNPEEWLSRWFFIMYKSEEQKEEILGIFNDMNFIKETFKYVFEANFQKIALFILANIDFDDENIKKFLYKKAFKEIIDMNKELELFNYYLMALIKQKEWGKIKENIDILVKNYRLFTPLEFLNMIFQIYLNFKIDERILNEEHISYLTKGLKYINEMGISEFIFVWNIIENNGLKDEFVNNFSDVLNSIEIENSLFLKNEKELLNEYLKLRNKLEEVEDLDVKQFEKFLFTEFSGSLLEKDLRERIEAKLKEEKKENLLNCIEFVLMRAPGDKKIFHLINSIVE